MTILELILITIIWIAYGSLTYNQAKIDWTDFKDCFWGIIFLVFSPIVLIIRALIGIFSSKIFN